MKEKTKWIKPRHTVVRNTAYWILYPYSKLKYGIRVDRFREKTDRQYLVLFNHQTAFDQFFVGMAFRRPVYYLASEDLFSNGWVSSLIRYLVAPIPIKKQTTDIRAIKDCIRVVKEGGTLAIAPEGNRTFSGKTEYMSPSIVYLARKLGLPILLYRLEGGYGVQPRWSDVVRRGSMHCYVSRVIEPEEAAAMTNEELFAAIEQGLYVNEANASNTFRHKRRAEYLERAMYVCPDCGLTTFCSEGHLIRCTTCGKQISYGETTELSGVGAAFPFRFVDEWYEYQKEFVNRLDPMAYTEEPLYRETVTLSEVIPYKQKLCLRKQAEIALYGDRIVIDEASEDPQVFSFGEIGAVTILGKNKLNLYRENRIYQVKGDKRFNALKYVNLFHRFLNVAKGEKDGQFLGL